MSKLPLVRLTSGTPSRPPGSTHLPDVAVDPQGSQEIAILVRGRAGAQTLPDELRRLAGQLPRQRRYLDLEELERLYGADPDSVEQVETFAAENSLSVVSADGPTRLLRLRGAVSDCEKAFGVEFAHYGQDGQTYRTVTGPVHIPASLEGHVVGVFGLDELPRFERPIESRARPAAGAAPLGSEPQPIPANEVERLYGFPTEATGRGQRIAIVLLGGGYRKQDLKDYFALRGLERGDIECHEIGGQERDRLPEKTIQRYLQAFHFAPDDGGDPDKSEIKKIIATPGMIPRIWWNIEATLDVQLTASFAPAAEIVVYFAPNNERGMIEGLAAALSDSRPPTVVTCSWGEMEESLDATLLSGLDWLFQTAALRGITICYSSGDFGALVGKDGQAHVRFPASSPHVLACGGTRLDTSSGSQETGWSEKIMGVAMSSGGGFSRFFDQPQWGAGEDGGEGGRGVPDVAGKADISGGYEIIVAGTKIPMGGTSAAAPMWAGLIARLNEALGAPLGWVTPLLYRPEVRRGLRDITKGQNQRYHCGPGWDPMTGLGSPRGQELLRALAGQSD